MKDELLINLLLAKLYEAEKKLPNRNFAKTHSFEEWKQRLIGMKP